MRRALAIVALLLGCSGASEPPRPSTPPQSNAASPPSSATSAPYVAPPVSAFAQPDVPRPPPKKQGICSVSVFLSEECADKDGVYQVEGYVVAAHRCPPCPPRAVCKPCDDDFVMLSDTRDPGSTPTTLGSSNLRVMVPVSVPFAVGQRVKVKVLSGPMLFLGDPCCTPGRYVVPLAPL